MSCAEFGARARLAPIAQRSLRAFNSRMLRRKGVRHALIWWHMTVRLRPSCGRVSLLTTRRGWYGMGMPATPTVWTVEMLDSLPDDGQRYEIIDGELFVTPAPVPAHQLVLVELIL